MTSELARTAHVAHYAESIADKFLRRPTLASANALAAATEDPSVSTDECLQQIQESLLELEAAFGRTTARHVREFMPEVLRELETQAANQGLVGMSTGIPSLDRVTGGIRRGELWTIGALPGRGKTALRVQVALANGTAQHADTRFQLGDAGPRDRQAVPGGEIVHTGNTDS